MDIDRYINLTYKLAIFVYTLFRTAHRKSLIDTEKHKYKNNHHFIHHFNFTCFTPPWFTLAKLICRLNGSPILKKPLRFEEACIPQIRELRSATSQPTLAKIQGLIASFYREELEFYSSTIDFLMHMCTKPSPSPLLPSPSLSYNNRMAPNVLRYLVHSLTIHSAAASHTHLPTPYNTTEIVHSTTGLSTRSLPLQPEATEHGPTGHYSRLREQDSQLDANSSTSRPLRPVGEMMETFRQRAVKRKANHQRALCGGADTIAAHADSSESDSDTSNGDDDDDHDFVEPKTKRRRAVSAASHPIISQQNRNKSSGKDIPANKSNNMLHSTPADACRTVTDTDSLVQNDEVIYVGPVSPKVNRFPIRHRKFSGETRHLPKPDSQSHRSISFPKYYSLIYYSESNCNYTFLSSDVYKRLKTCTFHFDSVVCYFKPLSRYYNQ